MLDQRLHAARGGVAGGLVAGQDEQNGVGEDLVVGHRFAVDLGLDEGGHDAVVRVAALVLDVGGEVALQAAHAGLPRLAAGASLLILGIFRADELVGPAEDVFPGIALDGQELADRGHRHPGGDIADEFGFAAVGQLIDQVSGGIIDHVFGDLVDSIFQ